MWSRGVTKTKRGKSLQSMWLWGKEMALKRGGPVLGSFTKTLCPPANSSKPLMSLGGSLLDGKNEGSAQCDFWSPSRRWRWPSLGAACAPAPPERSRSNRAGVMVTSGQCSDALWQTPTLMVSALKDCVVQISDGPQSFQEGSNIHSTAYRGHPRTGLRTSLLLPLWYPENTGSLLQKVHQAPGPWRAALKPLMHAW